jgi:hypothetical protein
MPNNRRTSHLLPAGIAGVAATLAIAVAMVGTAAAAQARDYRGVQDFRAAESDAGLAPVTTPIEDIGAQDFRGVQDFRAAESDAGLSVDAPSATVITTALQPGQTDSQVTTGNVDSLIGDPTQLVPSSGPTSATQPGQTDSQVVVRVASYDPAHEHLTSAPWPTSAPQPGQTGW